MELTTPLLNTLSLIGVPCRFVLLLEENTLEYLKQSSIQQMKAIHLDKPYSEQFIQTTQDKHI